MDIGANIGYYSLLASHTFKRVISFEASPTIYKHLVANLAANRADNVEPHNVFISNASGTTEFFRGPDNNLGLSSRTRMEHSLTEGQIPMAQLDEFVTVADMAAIRLIKVDVEGAEPEVADWILSSLAYLPDDLEIIMEFTPDSSDATRSQEDLFSRFLNSGFNAFALQGPYSLHEYIERNHGVEAPSHRIYECPHSLTDVIFKRATR